MGKLDCGAGPSSGLDDRTRDACLHKLGDHYAAGRLTASELDSRVQVALGAETEADLSEAITDLEAEGDESPARPSWRNRRPSGTPRSSVGRWAAGLLVVVAGGVLLALLGPGAAAAELAVGVTAGVLGYLTHWWLTRRASRPAAAEPRTVTRPRAPVLRDETWLSEDSDEAAIEAMSTPDPAPRLRSIRPPGRGTGGIPNQRSGD